jgi:hypothetical protein
MLGRVKKMPPLSKLTGERAQAQPMTWQQMKLNAQLWHGTVKARAGVPASAPTPAAARVRQRLAAKP